MKYILQDWAGNRLTDRQGNSIDFESFEDGWDYILENYEEDDFSDLFIEIEYPPKTFINQNKE